MACPICSNKMMNCDCTPLEREQAELIESLEDRIRELESELEHSKQVAWNRLSDTEKDEAIKSA
jgi:transcription initiation factor IIE alpha subunit